MSMTPHFAKRSLLLIALASSPLFPATAHAAPAIRDELPSEARKDWDAARELYDARDFQSALVQFERAYELSRNPRVLFNIGVCWKELTRYAAAVRVWERQLEFADRLSPEDVERVKSAIAAARPFVSTLSVQVEEPDALLSIDGHPVGKSPFLGPVPIDVGRRRVTLQKEGFSPAEATVDVVRGTPSSVVLKLEPLVKMSTVSINVTGAHGVTLFVDGRELGGAPFTGSIPAGPHTFEARAQGYVSARQTSEVVYGKRLNLTLSLSEARSEGKVRILTNHHDATISIDGDPKGTGAWEGLLSAGGHQLRVVKPGFESHTAELSLSPGQQRTLQVNLVKEKSWVWWTVGIATVVGGGTVAAILLSRPTENSAVTGTLGTF